MYRNFLIAACLSLAMLHSGCSNEQSAAEPAQPVTEGTSALAALDPQAIANNNRGVALMGSFDYAAAHQVFSQLVAAEPDWTDAHLNLAIATLNRQQPGDEQRALAIALGVIEQDPKNLRAHYIAGILGFNAGDLESAQLHFEAVAAGDPQDAYAQYFLAQTRAQQGEFESALAGYRAALTIDPYLRSAYYGAFTAAQRLAQRELAGDYLADYQRLADNPRARLAEIKYTRMGDRAMAMAAGDGVAVEPVTKPQGALFGEAQVLADGQSSHSHLALGDLSGNGSLDLLIDGARWVPAAQSGFDFTQASEVTGPITGEGFATLGDVDNDGRTDIFAFGPLAGDLWLHSDAGFVALKLESPARDALVIDADHDGDLDLLMATADGRVELLNNNRDGSFRALASEAQIQVNASRVVAVDLDSDRDIDLLFIDDSGNSVFLNDRLWSWRKADGFEAFASAQIDSLISADLNADGQTELYAAMRTGGVQRFAPDEQGIWHGSPLELPVGISESVHWMAMADADGDGREDLWIADPDRGWWVLDVNRDQTSVLHHQATPARGWALYPGLQGPELLALAGDQLLHWPAGPGRYPFITLTLSGMEDQGQSMRSNASGIGTALAVRYGSQWSVLASGRRDSGPGASLLPVQVGLGGAAQADYIALEWSDGVYQTELDVPTATVTTISETQRQLASCPVLFSWNGTEFVFVSDVLGVGGIGFAVGKGEYAKPRPWEHFLMPEGSLVARDGAFEIRFTEPMEELAYLDFAELRAYDLPPGWNMVLDERMGTGAPEPSGEPWYYRDLILPVAARTDSGDEVLQAISAADLKAADPGLPDPRFVGFLKSPQRLTLEFSEDLGKSWRKNQDQGLAQDMDMTPVLIMNGWVEYGYSQTGFAAWQAGIRYQPPSLEIQRQGRWQSWLPQFGYPAGMPRVAALPLTDLPADTTGLRLSTNQEIYYDRLAVALATQDLAVGFHRLPLSDARVKKSGFPERKNLAQRRPSYDYNTRKPFWDTRYAAGFYTALGPALELLSKQDDALAIIAGGEEIQLRFNADLPPVAKGWTRRYVAVFHGWAKDMDLYTLNGETVGPLPSTGVDPSSADQLHARLNTRYQEGR